MKMRAVHVKCDGCGVVDCYGKNVESRGWIQAGIYHVDEDGSKTELHVCPTCARKAIDEWLPKHTCWGSTEHWSCNESLEVESA